MPLRDQRRSSGRRTGPGTRRLRVCRKIPVVLRTQKLLRHALGQWVTGQGVRHGSKREPTQSRRRREHKTGLRSHTCTERFRIYHRGVSDPTRRRHNIESTTPLRSGDQISEKRLNPGGYESGVGGSDRVWTRHPTRTKRGNVLIGV